MPLENLNQSVELLSEVGEKSGWLLKWTNYIKGYRQRWFALDLYGNLNYYRLVLLFYRFSLKSL